MTLDRISGICLLLLAVFIAFETRVLPLGSHDNPGPGYLPLMLASFLAALSLLLVIRGKLSPPWKSIRWPEKYHAWAIIGSCFFAAFCIEPLGYRITIVARPGIPLRRPGADEDRLDPGIGLRPVLGIVLGIRYAVEGAPAARRLRNLMVETLQSLLQGFSTALSASNLFYAFMGCLIGTMVGVLPGVGPLAGISLLLPTTFGLEPTAGLILLCGVYYGAMYGGSTTSILMRIPGEAASVMTCIDGYAMALNGRAGPALSIAAIGSFVAGTVSIVGLMFLAPPLARFALRFGPPEYTALLVLGLFVLGYMTGGSMAKNLIMIALGLLFGMVGIDQMTGYFRFSYGVVALGDGIGVVPVAVGLFGIAEILATAGNRSGRRCSSRSSRTCSPRGRSSAIRSKPIGRGTRSRLPHRHHPRIGPHHLHLHLLRRGAAAVQTSGAVRKGRHRGRGRPGIGEQRGQLRGAGPHAGPGRPHGAHPGGAAGGPDGPRDHPGAAVHQGTARRSSGGSLPACTWATWCCSS